MTSPDKRGAEDDGETAIKRLRLSSSVTPVGSSSPTTPESAVDDKIEDKIEKSEAQLKREQWRREKEARKEEEKVARQRRKEEERLEREQKKEEDRLLKEKRKQDERREKELKKERERQQREQKKEEERLEKERKKEEERLERERKKEEERLERERKKEEERLERERKKEEEKMERERKREDERLKREEEKRRAEEEKNKGQKKISNFFTQKKSPKKSATPAQQTSDRYHKMFLPFFQKQNTLMPTPMQLEPRQLADSIQKFDALLSSPVDDGKAFFARTRRAVRSDVTTPDQVIAALNSADTTEAEVYQMLQNIPPIKYLHFYENSKPPYIGTWCSADHNKIRFPVHEPFNTAVTGLDYEYDSDLDWNGEEDEGEDIDEDDDEDDDDMDEDDGEMEDFVEATDSKKRKLMGPLVPVVHWNDGSDEAIFDEIKYERLHVNIQFTVDPEFNYWAKAPSDEAVTASKDADKAAAVAPAPAASTTPSKPRITDPQAVRQLIEFIEKNNEFTIGTLVELSKKEFQNYTKALIRHTIQDVAVYNKKTANWEVKPQLKQELP